MKRRALSTMIGVWVALGVTAVACSHGGAVGATVPPVDGGGGSAESGSQPKGICSTNCPSTCSANKDCPQDYCANFGSYGTACGNGPVLLKRFGLRIGRRVLPDESGVQADRVRRVRQLLPALLFGQRLLRSRGNADLLRGIGCLYGDRGVPGALQRG
jgi:hypothetical protein